MKQSAREVSIDSETRHIIDIGSGSGFSAGPGLPGLRVL